MRNIALSQSLLKVHSHTLVPPVILLGSELNLMVMTGDCSRGGGGVGGRGDDGANSARRLTKSRDSLASLCNVAASSRDSLASLCNVDVSRDARLGFECVNPLAKFASILRAAFAPIFFSQKNYKAKL